MLLHIILSQHPSSHKLLVPYSELTQISNLRPGGGRLRVGVKWNDDLELLSNLGLDVLASPQHVTADFGRHWNQHSSK